MLAAIDLFDREIAAVACTLPDYALFQGLPGAGLQLAPRLLAAFGELRDRSHGAGELQKYSGIAPVTERSGKKSWVHWRWQCPKFRRQTFVEWASQTIDRSFWPAPTTRSSVRGAVLIRQACGPRRSSGSASCTAAGRPALRTTRPPTSTP
ncbi:transposase [Paraburkholderia sp. SIMBA_054]|uniref:transposase n=1 Tax=Paraburkholderia sp. SIMBA_054 TaxID=3085795 RepID=UPI0039783E93